MCMRNTLCQMLMDSVHGVLRFLNTSQGQGLCKAGRLAGVYMATDATPEQRAEVRDVASL